MKYCMICAGLLLDLKGGPALFEFTTFKCRLKICWNIFYLPFNVFTGRYLKTAPFHSSDFKKGQRVLVFSHHHDIIYIYI